MPPPKACKICSANFQETFDHDARVFHGEGQRLQRGLQTASHPAGLNTHACLSLQLCTRLAAAALLLLVLACRSLCLAWLASETRLSASTCILHAMSTA